MDDLLFTIDGKPAYRLKKLDPGWELIRYDHGGKVIERGSHKGELTKSGWKKMASGNGLYPHTIRHALDLIMDDIILSHPATKAVPVVDGLRAIRTEIGKLEGALEAAASQADSLLDLPVSDGV